MFHSQTFQISGAQLNKQALAQRCCGFGSTRDRCSFLTGTFVGRDKPMFLFARLGEGPPKVLMLGAETKRLNTIE